VAVSVHGVKRRSGRGRILRDSELTAAVLRCIAGCAMWAYSATQPGGLSGPGHSVFLVANIYAVVLLAIVARLHRRELPYPGRLVAALTVLDHVLVLVLAAIDDGVGSLVLGVLALVVTTDAARRGVRAGVGWAIFDASAIACYGLLIDVDRTPFQDRLRLVAWWGWLLIGGAVLAGVIARAAFDYRQTLEDERRKLAALAQADMDRRAFLAVISHELRTPLASIGALCNALARPEGLEDSETRDEAVALIESHAVHLTGLMEDIRRLSRGDAPQEQVPRPREFDVGRMVREAASAAGIDFGRLQVDLEGAPLTMISDQAKLRRVLTNLLENAARHSAGLVEVEVRSLGGRVAFSVLDRGTGISTAIADQVFERGFTFGHQRDSSGLGLWIVRELVNQLGGEVSALPRPGGGVCVIVHVPSVTARSSVN
jgi:signal transduction histidine kinase